MRWHRALPPLALIWFAVVAGAHTYPRLAESTAYCLKGTMADGTKVRRGSVAMNRHPLGTRITIKGHGPDGRTRYTVRDRIGSGSELDFWVRSCGTARGWGRRHVNYRLGW